jgi:hypothetical protein
MKVAASRELLVLFGVVESIDVWLKTKVNWERFEQ